MNVFFHDHRKEVKEGFKDLDSILHRTGVALGFQRERRGRR